jgi:hypothetical protein
MTISAADIETYREQVSRWSRLLSSGQLEAFHAELEANPNGMGARMHRGNSQGERRRIFREGLLFVALVFPEFDALIDTYIEQEPRQPLDLYLSHQERFLHWLRTARSLTPQQADFVTYQLSEYAVLSRARRDHKAHVRFQRLVANSPEVSALEMSPERRLHLNPTCIWTQLSVLELTPHADRTEVLFYADGGDVKFLNLTPVQKAWVEALAEQSPCTLGEWSRRTSGPDEADLLALARQLASHRIVAVAD